MPEQLTGPSLQCFLPDRSSPENPAGQSETNIHLRNSYCYLVITSSEQPTQRGLESSHTRYGNMKWYVTCNTSTFILTHDTIRVYNTPSETSLDTL